MSSNYEEICKKNIKEYGEGSRHLSYFTDIYSTRTHFIFEVLQNAEDALSRRPAGSDAGYVHFHLHSDRLEIRHNGALFNELDVTGICGIGEGTKAEDSTQIGKFGIGFKSVYAYTFFPKIYSGGEHFEIRRFVEPHEIASVNGKDTLIILPFDQPDKRPDWAFRENVPVVDAVREIGNAIRKLGIRTLLFLRHIEEIKWALPDGTSGCFIRNTEPLKCNDGLRKVEVLDQDDFFEEWRIFSRDVEVQDAGQSHQVTVEIAFLLKDGAVTRADNTELIVFFPTEKKTGLGFLIQAPFKATKARDNIKTDDSANRQLIEAAAELAADSLLALRDLGLLSIASFAALPLRARHFSESNLSESNLFRPVYDKVRGALKTQPLLPAHGGRFIKADEAKLARGKELVELFLPEQLGLLFGKDRLVWLDATITESGETADLHTYLVGRKKNQWVKEWEQEPLIENIEVEAKNVAPKLTADFFQDQDEQWLIKFYAYLGKNFAAFQGAPFVRLENGQHVLPGTVEKPTAYLPPANASTIINQDIFPLVKQSLASNSEVSKFLRQTAHLREPDKIDVVIRCLLPKFCTAIVTFERDGYVRDLKEIAAAYSSVKPNDATRLVDILKETRFVAAVPANNPQSGVVWIKPGDSSLYRQSLELEQWFAGNATDNAWFPISVVGENLPDDLKSKLGFALGGLIKRSSSSGWDSKLGRYRRPEGGFDAYADIVGLKWAIDHPSNERAIYLWNRLLENVNLIKGKEIRSTNLQFPANKTEEFNDYSIMGNHCKGYWLPKQNVEGFFRPAELLLSELPEGFEKSTPRAESVARALMKKPEVEQALDLVTNGDDELKKLIAAYQSGSNADREKLRKMIPQELPPQPALSFKDGLAKMARSQRGMTSLDDASNPLNHPVSNPDRYHDKINQEIDDGVQEHAATQKTIRFSPVRDQPSNKEARQTLYQEYQGRCQVTGGTFPKASANANGEAANYFEVCSLLPYGNADYLNDAGNMLCVSADTMAKLNHASFEWLDDIEHKIAEFDNGGKTAQEIKIRIWLAGEECTITWSQRHFMRLVALYQRA